MSRNPLPVEKPKIVWEYIGVKPNCIDFPVAYTNQFILGFATEVYDNGIGTGIFKRKWSYDCYSPEIIEKLKKDHDEIPVKVVISIGGRASGDTKYPFNTTDKELWIKNAKNSLKGIIKEDYKGQIDGIDINYENIESNDFSYCMGEVINGLKNNDGVINLVSIAPSYPVQAYYKTLYEANEHVIDWVNYQFYDQLVPSSELFIKLYSDLSNVYKKKLLAGFSTDPNDAGKLSEEVFFEALKELLKSGSFPGVFVWNANDSSLNKFKFEKDLLGLADQY